MCEIGHKRSHHAWLAQIEAKNWQTRCEKNIMSAGTFCVPSVCSHNTFSSHRFREAFFISPAAQLVCSSHNNKLLIVDKLNCLRWWWRRSCYKWAAAASIFIIHRTRASGLVYNIFSINEPHLLIICVCAAFAAWNYYFHGRLTAKHSRRIFSLHCARRCSRKKIKAIKRLLR